jgi:hypothetical protein
LVLPAEDRHIAFGNTQTVDVCQGERAVGFFESCIPIGEALLPTGPDGGPEIGSNHGIDVDGARLIRLLAEDSELG